MRKQISYFEEYLTGEEGETCGRTFTEGDLVQFASMASDFCPPHMDRHTMAKTPYGERISHGFFLNSLATGMLSWHAPYLTGRDNPNACLRSLVARFPIGIHMGDTMKFHWTIQEKTPDPTQPGFGIIKTVYQFINQDNGIAAEGTITTDVRMKDSPDAKLLIKPEPALQFDDWEVDYNKVYYYEDFIVGKGEKTGGRVVTETDVVNYMGLVGDYDRLYTDPLYAKDTLFGERIVPWMLAADFIGMALRDGAYFNLKKPFVPYAGHLGDDITFIAPAKIGDVLYTIFKIESARISKNKPDRGVLVLRQQIVNQRDEALVDVRLATTVPVKAGMTFEPKETEWVLHTIKR